MSRLFFFCLFVLSTGYSLPLLYTSGSSKITFFRTDPATALSPYNKEKLGKRAQMHTSGERAFSGQAVTSSAQYPHLKTEAIIFCLSQIMLLWYFIFHSSEYLIYARLSALPAVLKIKKKSLKWLIFLITTGFVSCRAIEFSYKVWYSKCPYVNCVFKSFWSPKHTRV